MFSIHDEIKLKELLTEHGHKTYRYAQIEHAIYKDLITDFDAMTTIPKEMRELLKEHCYFMALRVKSQVSSDDGQTTKFLIETPDGKFMEAVIMRHLSGRNTLCVSSQVGCPMACTFCATGKLGLTRNLEFGEIVEQIMIAVAHLAKEDKKLRNVVYMGMGEPFLNYDNVKRSIEIACGQKKLDLSNRRITVSTCGIIPGIRRFTTDFPQTSLAISLHAPTDEARRAIMPVEQTYPLDKLMAALDEYSATTNKRVFYEYIMINGLTDRPEYAKKLAELLRGRLAHVNFIPYNPGEGSSDSPMQPTSKIMIKKFQDALEAAGVPSTIRHTMGDDIDAACGQLALKEEEN